MILTFIVLVTVNSALFAYTAAVSDSSFTIDKTIPSYLEVADRGIVLLPSWNNSCNDNNNVLRELLKLNNETTTTLVDTLSDAAGGFHESYREYYRGILVDGTRYTIHYKNGFATSLNGNFIAIDNLDVTPKITREQALASLASALNDSEKVKYAWDTTKLSLNQNGQLVIYLDNGTPRLTYKFHMKAVDLTACFYVYVDAKNGKVLKKRNSLRDATATVMTMYAGQRTIQTAYSNSYYRLRDYTRGDGIETYRYTTNFQIGIDPNVDYTSSNNSWNLTGIDKAALDAHWGAERTYDYYLNSFGRNSYDNDGAAIISYVNRSDYGNAYWNGDVMVYGESGDTTYVCLDIVAHEITHAFTQSTSDLIYEGEPGAIDEGLSDVFATCIEHYAMPEKGDSIWIMGENIETDGMRDLRTPYCNYYKGQNWVSINPVTLLLYDNGGVHNNSGVFSYWFYLLSHGGNGTNEGGYYYNVNGIGLDKAIQVCYLMNSAYLFSNSTYADARICSLMAAQQLEYGEIDINQIRKAWDAVGVRAMSISGNSTLCNTNEYTAINIPNGATVSWYISGTTPSSISLQSNTPSANQCTITRSGYAEFNNIILCADIIKNNVLLTTCRKTINRDSFSGTYEESSILYNGSFTPSIPLTAIPGSREMDVYVGGLVKVKSDYFSGKSISISGPYTNYYRSGSLVRFTLSIPELRSPTRSLSWSGAPVVITVQAEGCDDEVRLKFFPAIMLDDYSLNISPDGNSTYALSLIRKTEDGLLPETSSAGDDYEVPRLFCKPWTLEVTNALTGRKAFSKEVAEPSFLLHTDGWEAGVYVVRALVGEKSLAGKITVK